MKYKLVSQDTDTTVFESEKFEIGKIKSEIIGHLVKNKNDVLEYWINNQIHSFYAFPSIVNKICKLVLIGGREYYKPLSIN